MGKIELSQRTLIIDFMNSSCSLLEVSGALGKGTFFKWTRPWSEFKFKCYRKSSNNSKIFT